VPAREIRPGLSQSSFFSPKGPGRTSPGPTHLHGPPSPPADGPTAPQVFSIPGHPRSAQVDLKRSSRPSTLSHRREGKGPARRGLSLGMVDRHKGRLLSGIQGADSVEGFDSARSVTPTIGGQPVRHDLAAVFNPGASGASWPDRLGTIWKSARQSPVAGCVPCPGNPSLRSPTLQSGFATFSRHWVSWCIQARGTVWSCPAAKPSNPSPTVGEPLEIAA
jgi:hypothetical protein